jgi:transcriptional regulator with XRE-family HTH domain
MPTKPPDLTAELHAGFDAGPNAEKPAAFTEWRGLAWRCGCHMAREGLPKPIKVTQSRRFFIRVDDKIWHQIGLDVWSFRDPWPKPKKPRRTERHGKPTASIPKLAAPCARRGSAIPARNGTPEMIADVAFHRALGAAVRKRRAEKGLIMETLAHYLGVTHQQVQKWETGENRLSALNLIRIASRLTCSANELLVEAGVAESPSTQGDRLFIETVRALRGLSRKHLQAVHGLIKALGDEEAQVVDPILQSGKGGITPRH